MNKLGYFSNDTKKCNSSDNLISIEKEIDSDYISHEKNNRNLSEDENYYKNKNTINDISDDNMDLELILSNEKEEKFENKIVNDTNIKINEEEYLSWADKHLIL